MRGVRDWIGSLFVLPEPQAMLTNARCNQRQIDDQIDQDGFENKRRKIHPLRKEIDRHDTRQRKDN